MDATVLVGSSCLGVSARVSTFHLLLLAVGFIGFRVYKVQGKFLSFWSELLAVGVQAYAVLLKFRVP